MVSITRGTLKSGKFSYRVFIRFGGLKPITKQFKTKKAAIEYARRIEGDAELAAAKGNPVIHQFTLADVIDKFLVQY